MPSVAVSPQRREEVLDALRRGTVPASSLDLLAVGLERFEPTILAELDAVRTGRGVLKAVRGEYGEPPWVCRRLQPLRATVFS